MTRDGLFTADPKLDPAATLVERVDRIDATVEAYAGGSEGSGTGGMITKLKAARLATTGGTDVVLASGLEPDVVLRLAHGEHVGTLFPAGRRPPREPQALDPLRPLDPRQPRRRRGRRQGAARAQDQPLAGRRARRLRRVRARRDGADRDGGRQRSRLRHHQLRLEGRSGHPRRCVRSASPRSWATTTGQSWCTAIIWCWCRGRIPPGRRARGITSTRVIRRLQVIGFEIDHVTGSHYIMKHSDGRRVSVPRHRTVKTGLLLNQLQGPEFPGTSSGKDFKPCRNI